MSLSSSGSDNTMQQTKELKHTHFGLRLKERFGVEFTHGIRMEFFKLIKEKKLHLEARERVVNPKTGASLTHLIFKGKWRGQRIVLIMSNLGDFITIIDPDNSLLAFATKGTRYENVSRTAYGKD